ncbi:MAG: AMP-binding protein [Bacteroidota bacterium]
MPFHADEVKGSLGGRFARVLEAVPDRIALRWGKGALRYAELDRASAAVAATLLDRLGPEPEPVALYMRQGADAVAAVLGSVRAGKTYVPLDPGFPAKRTARILQQALPSLVLTHADLEETARDAVGAVSPVIVAPGAFEASRGEPVSLPSDGAGPDTLGRTDESNLR